MSDQSGMEGVDESSDRYNQSISVASLIGPPLDVVALAREAFKRAPLLKAAIQEDNHPLNPKAAAKPHKWETYRSATREDDWHLVIDEDPATHKWQASVHAGVLSIPSCKVGFDGLDYINKTNNEMALSAGQGLRWECLANSSDVTLFEGFTGAIENLIHTVCDAHDEVTQDFDFHVEELSKGNTDPNATGISKLDHLADKAGLATTCQERLPHMVVGLLSEVETKVFSAQEDAKAQLVDISQNGMISSTITDLMKERLAWTERSKSPLVHQHHLHAVVFERDSTAYNWLKSANLHNDQVARSIGPVWAALDKSKLEQATFGREQREAVTKHLRTLNEDQDRWLEKVRVAGPFDGSLTSHFQANPLLVSIASELVQHSRSAL